MLSNGDLVKLLGISGHYRGFSELAACVNLAAADEDLMSPISTRLYPLVAARHGVTTNAVISNLRYLVKIWWKRGNRGFSPEYLVKDAQRPGCKAFVYSLVTYVQRKTANKN